MIGTGDAIIADDTVMADYHFTANAVRDVIFVIGNDYHVATDVVDGITVNSYYHSGREEKGQEALNVAMDTLKDCNYRLGTYPYSRFNVVETQMEMLGMEYPQVVLITMADEGVPSSVVLLLGWQQLLYQRLAGRKPGNLPCKSWARRLFRLHHTALQRICQRSGLHTGHVLLWRINVQSSGGSIWQKHHD